MYNYISLFGFVLFLIIFIIVYHQKSISFVLGVLVLALQVVVKALYILCLPRLIDDFNAVVGITNLLNRFQCIGSILVLLLVLLFAQKTKNDVCR